MWRKKRDGACPLERRESLDPIAIGFRLSGNDHPVGAFPAPFEETWLKEIRRSPRRE
jgi:hypothetical protein